ncbi:alpha/beta hydrolase [Alcanivorax sp. JB21]|uniref:alpha/beta fold hydrolase n=1 Tax=Alcanivorax limicola TaxID=2874102 RepID=UPI001CBB8AC7|nr:alpha/beta hydrolase [Alcanivorax limicola]MBZ2187876.1 alpha/beta hydrolase [Alcanivorax limicola]
MDETWVLLRGLVREARHWEGLPALLSQHRPGARVVTPDLPGNGRYWQTRSPDTIADMVESLRADLSEQGVKPPWHIMALSLGGMMAVEWMKRYPDELASVTVINSSAAGFNNFWQRVRPTAYLSILRFILLRRDALARETLVLKLTSNMTDSAERARLARRWADYAAQQPVSINNALRQLRAGLTFNAPRELPGSVPLLLISGAGDRMVNPICSVTLAAAWHCALRVHPHAGHDLPIDAPRWLIDTLNDWLPLPSGGKGP